MHRALRASGTVAELHVTPKQDHTPASPVDQKARQLIYFFPPHTNQDLAHPYLSPLFGDLSGFPPTILTTGTRDLYLSNTVRMHRALRASGTVAELHVTEAGPHTGFPGGPEGAAIDLEVRGFIERVIVT